MGILSWEPLEAEQPQFHVSFLQTNLNKNHNSSKYNLFKPPWDGKSTECCKYQEWGESSWKQCHGGKLKSSSDPAPLGMWWPELCFPTDRGTQQLITELSQGTAFLRDARCQRLVMQLEWENSFPGNAACVSATGKTGGGVIYY